MLTIAFVYWIEENDFHMKLSLYSDIGQTAYHQGFPAWRQL